MFVRVVRACAGKKDKAGLKMTAKVMTAKVTRMGFSVPALSGMYLFLSQQSGQASEP